MKRRLAIFILVLSSLMLQSCKEAGYSFKNATENTTEYSINVSYDNFHGEKSEVITIDEGVKPSLHFSFVTESGNLDVYVKDAERKLVYVKNSVGTSEFKVDLESAGEYIVTMIGDEHKGSFNMFWGSNVEGNSMYVNPYQNLSKGKWRKANFHTHAGTGPNTCGSNDIDVVVNAYREANFSFLAISNHDLFSDTSEFTDKNMTMVPGVEYSVQEHMVTVGCDQSLHEYDHQTAINMTKEAGGFTILAHPNWPQQWFWNKYRLLNLKGYIGIEAINMLINRLPTGEPIATDVWDYLLTKGRLVYGFGNDDMHQLGDVNKSYNIIYTEDIAYESMRKAIDNGRFCASTGLFPEYLVLEGDIIKVKARDPKQPDNNTFTYRFITEEGKVLLEQTTKEGQYTLNGEKYVRVEVIDNDGSLLLFQPVYLKDALIFE